ncbi:cytochrome b/b6 domain-containing protein [Synechococcus sp. CBW1002]|uniref:cytochrome b/b6 domain-containing protein n=1 Tax=Synechococcus sp. CBW1002 TaxID=1353134 RepID=UPI0018CF2207|nr:cytochrome b/b6 domain-containing protein [Synechococcus sp. CBW1002]QPN60642.1 cytochrome b/b6 domain-containing protein [Synechococcus sp. CBW1002]
MPEAPVQSARIRHAPWWTRAFHGFNLLVLVVMAASGLQIYNANPVFGGREGATIPDLLTLGGWLAGGRDWHFGFMGLYALNLGVWIALLLVQRRRRLAQAGDLSTLKGSGNAGKRQLASHRLVYSLMLILLGFSLITGLAMYKPAQFWWLSSLFSFGEAFGVTAWQTLRVCHFATIPAIALLLIAHVLLSWRIGGMRLLRSMLA